MWSYVKFLVLYLLGCGEEKLFFTNSFYFNFSVDHDQLLQLLLAPLQLCPLP